MRRALATAAGLSGLGLGGPVVEIDLTPRRGPTPGEVTVPYTPRERTYRYRATKRAYRPDVIAARRRAQRVARRITRRNRK
jgi:hypothetical protein